MDNPRYDTGLSKRPAKRTKGASACENCRGRKVRCDELRPVCGQCLRKGLREEECLYRPVKISEGTASQRQYIQHLESKIRELEYGNSGSQYTIGQFPAPDSTVRAARQDTFILDTNQTTSASTNISQHDSGSFHQVTGIENLALRSDQGFAVADAGRSERPSDATDSIVATATSPQNPHHDQVRPQSSVGSGDPQGSDPQTGCSPLLKGGLLGGVDAMGTLEGDIPEGESNHAGQVYFGRSSAKSFMRQVRVTVEAKSQEPCASLGYSSQMPPVAAGLTTTHSHTVEPDYVLPPRSTADRLIQIYWTESHTLYPFVHKPSFQKEYEELWTGSDSPNTPMFHCILNIAFALGCQLNAAIPPESRESVSMVYFERSRQLLHFDILEGGDFEVVQALLLMGQYLQSTNSPSRCWNVVGMAVRIAQGLGLHHQGTKSMLSTQRDREMRRRVWHGCVLMDRIVSVVLGRPAMIATIYATSVPLPAGIDDEFLSAEVNHELVQPSGQPSKMEFFRATLQLYEVLADIISRFYGPRPDGQRTSGMDSENETLGPQDYASVLDLDRRLAGFWESLPEVLNYSQVEPDTHTHSAFVRQSNVLRARFLHTRTILFRPMLAQLSLRQECQLPRGCAISESLLQHSLLLRSARMCVSTAEELIALIFRNITDDSSTTILPAWWYNVFYVYTAATVIIAGRLCPAILAKTSKVTSDQAWQQSIKILQKYERQSWSARRCAAALELLNNKIGLHRVARYAPEDYSAQPHNAIGIADSTVLNANEHVAIEDPTLLSPMAMDWDWLNSVPLDFDYRI